jgi:hypothetical protein
VKLQDRIRLAQPCFSSRGVLVDDARAGVGDWNVSLRLKGFPHIISIAKPEDDEADRVASGGIWLTMPRTSLL